MISADDIANVERVREKEDWRLSSSQTAKMLAASLDGLMDGFDPENDLTDRRIFYEVTGESLIPFEFLNDDSFEGEEAPNEILDPLTKLQA